MALRTRLLISAILIALLTSCSGGSAVGVAKKFWDAVNDGKVEKARSYATKETAASLTINDGGGNVDVDVDVEFGESTVEGDRTIIETRTVTRMGDFNQTVEMKTILVLEEGKWKVDVTRTMMSMFPDEVQEMMQGMAENMGQTMENMGNAMLEEMQKSFGQFGFGSRFAQAPELLTATKDYTIKFGHMKRRSDGTYYVYKETTKIPMRTRGFRWGYTIESKVDPFTTYSVDYAPDGPMSPHGYPRTNSEGEQGWESNTTTVMGGRFTHVYRNDTGDTPGPRKIEVFIQDKLAKTIEFEVGGR